jgi:hypothetical protein
MASRKSTRITTKQKYYGVEDEDGEFLQTACRGFVIIYLFRPAFTIRGDTQKMWQLKLKAEGVLDIVPCCSERCDA